ncbi:hypothetical protein AK812_SmicGene31313 [Symbiodinium microadriaticum]|uniref:Uncharacterized protein n=1 Tax=Symbiodinium microadriaticum TaxID=2951 RepID=A0A1Q9CX14_SYMMI|nr:hypothetical protein AK812_SmicGene31313 [Symbiodinium microadriaticum]CAE7283466.1 unnamed protein product [Symbiodinium sp. KB8]CAE7827836.1 unnamed protein product [Symbiodinium microadriaticum]
MSGGPDELERVTLRLAGLTIDISRDAASSSSLGSFEVVDLPGARTKKTGPIEGSEAAPATPVSLTDRLVNCTTAAELGSVDIGAFAEQARGLSATAEWTARGRAARALLAGVHAAKKLSGEIAAVPRTLPLSLSNRFYVCFRCSKFPEGFVTESFKVYKASCFNSRGTGPEAGSVSHGFPSKTEEIRGLVVPADAARPLGFVYFCDLEEDALQQLCEGEEDTAFFAESSVAGETPRRRPVGPVDILLADVPWRFLPFFRNGARAYPYESGWYNRQARQGCFARHGRLLDWWHCGRWESMSQPKAGPLQPTKRQRFRSQSAWSPWLCGTGRREASRCSGSRVGEDDGEYIGRFGPSGSFAERGNRSELGPFEVSWQRGTGGRDGAHSRRLGDLSSGGWSGRLAGHERAPRPEAIADDADLAELEAGVLEEGAVEGEEKIPASLHRLILTQTQVLTKLAQPKATEPLTAALSNMTKEESFLGAKRVRLLGRMGAEAMGVDATNVPSNLMLDYVERKMPVGDQKLLALVASFAASGWRAARDEGNVSLESWMSKLLVFCDQCSVEGHPAVRSVDPKRLDVSEFGLRQGDGLPRGPARGGNFNLRHGLKRSTVAPATGGGGPGCTEEAAKAAAAKTSGARRRDFVSRSLPACETSDANSGAACIPDVPVDLHEIFADRIKWTLPPSFNPLPFLTDPVVRAVFPPVAAKSYASRANGTIIRRDELRGVYLGAEADGETGIVGAPRCRVIVLVVLTALIARKGVASSSLLASVLGLWVHVLMFRRPVLALLNRSFLDSRREPVDRVMPLHRDTVNELLALSMLGPALQTDLRVSYTEKLFAMDASPDGAGLVEAPLPESVVKELWRFSEQRGFYTRLANPAADCLEGLGIDSAPAFEHTERPAVPQCFPAGRPLSEGVLCDALELCAETCEWTAAHKAAGLRSIRSGKQLNPGNAAPLSLSLSFKQRLRGWKDWFLTALYKDLPLDARLFRASMHVYRRQWNAIMARLGVPYTQAERGATPGVLRGSGATFLYLETEDISLVAWRGRWSKVKTIEFYLQEVAAQLLLMQLSSSSRRRISVLRKFARPLLELHVAAADL